MSFCEPTRKKDTFLLTIKGNGRTKQDYQIESRNDLRSDRNVVSREVARMIDLKRILGQIRSPCKILSHRPGPHGPSGPSTGVSGISPSNFPDSPAGFSGFMRLAQKLVMHQKSPLRGDSDNACTTTISKIMNHESGLWVYSYSSSVFFLRVPSAGIMNHCLLLTQRTLRFMYMKLSIEPSICITSLKRLALYDE